MRTVVTFLVLELLFLCGSIPPWGPTAGRSQETAPAQSSVSGRSSMEVEGQLLKVQGRYYVIKDREGKVLYLLVSQDTEMAGPFNPGDWIQVWTSPIEHAIAIRALSEDKNLEAEQGTMASATRTLTGRLVSTAGKYYVLVDAKGKELRILVNQDTELAGEFKPGDRLEVFTSPVEQAVAIRAAK